MRTSIDDSKSYTSNYGMMIRGKCEVERKKKRRSRRVRECEIVIRLNWTGSTKAVVVLKCNVVLLKI
jgi:hypothetical protein